MNVVTSIVPMYQGLVQNSQLGVLFFYDEPQLRCPECDPIGYGLFMNFDLFPHLCPEKRVEKTLEVESEEKETL